MFCFSPDSIFLVFADFHAYVVHVFNIENKSITKTIKIEDFIRSLAFSPNGNFLLMGTYRRIKVYTLPDY